MAGNPIMLKLIHVQALTCCSSALFYVKNVKMKSPLSSSRERFFLLQATTAAAIEQEEGEKKCIAADLMQFSLLSILPSNYILLLFFFFFIFLFFLVANLNKPSPHILFIWKIILLSFPSFSFFFCMPQNALLWGLCILFFLQQYLSFVFLLLCELEIKLFHSVMCINSFFFHIIIIIILLQKKNI